MPSHERALTSVLNGDLSAAPALRTAVERRGLDVQQLLADASHRSPQAMAAVVVALDAVNQASGLVATAWAAAEWDQVQRLGQGLGVQLDATICLRMQPLIDAANHRRRLRKITPRHLVRAMALARLAPHGTGFDHSGKSSSKTGLAFAVVHDDGLHLTLGAAACSGAKPSPGTAWSVVSPWQSRKPERNRAKALGWAARITDDRIVVPTAPLPTFSMPPPKPVVDPIDGALALGASRKAMVKLVSLANKAKADSADAVLARIDAGVADWPDSARVATNKWLQSLAVDHRKGRWRPGSRWYRHLEIIGRVPPEHVDALVASPFPPQFKSLVINESGERARDAAVAEDDWLVRLLRDANWERVRALVLELVWSTPLIARLASVPLLGRLQSLTIDGNPWTTQTQEMPTLLAACTALERLNVEMLGAAGHYEETFAQRLHQAVTRLTTLRHLELSASRFGRHNLVALLNSPTIDRLESLDINLHAVTDSETLVACFGGHSFEDLHTLVLRNLRFRADPVPLLARMPLGAVRHLQLGLEASLDASDLAGSPLFNGLESLRTYNLHGAAAILRGSDLTGLRVLELQWVKDQNTLDAVREVVSKAPIQELVLQVCQVPAAFLDMFTALIEAPGGIRHMRVLDLTNTSFRGLGHRLEACLPPGLERLVLQRCGLTGEEIRVLQRSPKFAQTTIVS